MECCSVSTGGRNKRGKMNDLSSCLDSSLGRKLGFVTRRKRGGGIRFSERITRSRRGRQMRTMHADMLLQFLAIFHGYKRRRMSGSRSCFARWFSPTLTTQSRTLSFLFSTSSSIPRPDLSYSGSGLFRRFSSR